MAGGSEPLDVDVPEYHRQLAAHFESTEPELWSWFREASRPSRTEIEAAELQLLKSAYRLDGDVHAALAGVATIAAGRLGIDREVVLHQELNAEDRNARVLSLGERIHVVFSGDLLDLLTLAEQEAVLFHELAHAHLLERESRRYEVLDRLVHRLDHEAVSSDALGETARRLRLHTEVWADRVALAACGDEPAVVAAIVKLSTGLRTVDPDAYLRQAREILEQDDASSRGWTHPELHVRIACLAARDNVAVDGIVADLIDGPDDLDHLDLLAQLRLQTMTARVLTTTAKVTASTGHGAGSHGGVAAYLRNYPELTVSDPSFDLLETGELASATASVRHLAAALLVDVALVAEDEAVRGLDRVGVLTAEAQRIGVGDEFDKILARAVDQTVAELRRSRT